MNRVIVIVLFIYFFFRNGDARVCRFLMNSFTTFDGYASTNNLLTDITQTAANVPLVFSLFDPSRLNSIMQMRGYPASVWLDDFSIFATTADSGLSMGTSDNVFVTFELRFCYSSCATLSTLSFGWTTTMVDGVQTSVNPYYFPPGADATNYYFKLENLDYNSNLYPPSYGSYDPNYGRRVLTFFDNILVLDVYQRQLAFDDSYAKIFESNTVGICGLVTQDVPNTDDDFLLPLQGGIYVFQNDPAGCNSYSGQTNMYMQQDGQCSRGAYSQGYNKKKCQFKPVCEFNRPHHIRTFDGKHTWIDKTIQSKLLLIEPCIATASPMPACWQNLIFNFAISTTEWMVSSSIFPNANSDIDQLTFHFSFCAISPNDPTICEQIEIDFGWNTFTYQGITPGFPWTLVIQGTTFLTIESWSTHQDISVTNVNSGLYLWEFKTITFCDGTKFSADAKNTFSPSAEMVAYLSNNNCGLCGDFNGDPSDNLEGFRTSLGGTYYADDMWNLNDITPFILQSDDGHCDPGTCDVTSGKDRSSDKRWPWTTEEL